MPSTLDKGFINKESLNTNSSKPVKQMAMLFTINAIRNFLHVLFENRIINKPIKHRTELKSDILHSLALVYRVMINRV